MRRSLPDEEPEEEMRPAKLLFYALFILALGIYASHALFDGMARTQEAREAVIAEAQRELIACKPGNSCTIKSLDMHVFLERGVRR